MGEGARNGDRDLSPNMIKKNKTKQNKKTIGEVRQNLRKGSFKWNNLKNPEVQMQKNKERL